MSEAHYVPHFTEAGYCRCDCEAAVTEEPDTDPGT